MTAPGSSSGTLHAAEPTSVPRFSVRFSGGRAELTLAAPLLLPGGQLTRLKAVVERAARVTDFARGWRALARRRSTLLEAELVLEPSWLGLGDAALSGGAPDHVLIERQRPWGHVALELAPAIDVGTEGDRSPELILVPLDARGVHPGPRPHLCELVELGKGDGDPVRRSPRFDPRRGALVLGDVLLAALTDALVPHGVRIPERALAPERASMRGGKLVLTVGTTSDASAGMLRELGRRLGPLLVAAAAGERVSPEALRSLPASLQSALGGAPAPGDPTRDLVVAVERGAPSDELARRARAVDERERAPGVATDALVLALGHVTEVAIARELALRAFARSPSRPDVIASALELAAARTDHDVAAEILGAAAQAAGERRDPHLDVALARLAEQRGDHDAAMTRWQRAASDGRAPGEALEGLARQHARRGRLDEAMVAMDRAVSAFREAGRTRPAIRAELAAARIVLTAREPRVALERLAALPGRYPASALDDFVLERTTLAAHAHRACGEASRAAIFESELARHVESAGASASDDAVHALFDAAQAAALADEGARADAMAATLTRVRPGATFGDAIRQAERAALRARIEAAPGVERAALARSLSDALSARGHAGDAAEVLFLSGELERDLGLMRAAIDAAERAGRTAQARALIDRTLAVVGEGPARAALEARRQKLG
jgi:hypothetical protein